MILHFECRGYGGKGRNDGYVDGFRAQINSSYEKREVKSRGRNITIMKKAEQIDGRDINRNSSAVE